jgi:enoyl-CoA hydratase
MALLPERLPAAEAVSWSLVNTVYPAEDFEAEVDKVIARLLAGPAVAFAKTKDAINAATLTELEPALEREFRGQASLLRSDDFKEGATAFQQRRSPNLHRLLSALVNRPSGNGSFPFWGMAYV